MNDESIRTLESLARTRQHHEAQRHATMTFTVTTLRKARAEGHTITELARAAGLTRQTIYSLLKEKES